MGSMTLAEHNKEGLAVWDHSWFASEHLESEISVLRRAACIAPITDSSICYVRGTGTPQSKEQLLAKGLSSKPLWP